MKETGETVVNPIPQNVAEAVLFGVPVVKKTPIKITKLRTPSVTQGKTVKYTGLSFEVGTRGVPILGIKTVPGKTRKVTAGTPTGIVEATSFEGGLPLEESFRTPAERRILFRGGTEKFPQREVEKLTTAFEITRATRKVRVPSGQFPKKTSTLGEPATKELLKFAKEEQAFLFGSFPTQAQLAKGRRRIPGDVDLKLSVSQAEAEVKTQQLVTRLRKKGARVRVSPQSPTLIEARVGPNKWAHAVDVKSLDPQPQDALVGASPLTREESFLGLPTTRKPVEIEGIKATSLTEQAARKFRGAFIATRGGLTPEQLSRFQSPELATAAREGAFLPKPYRVKDVRDFFHSSRRTCKPEENR